MWVVLRNPVISAVNEVKESLWIYLLLKNYSCTTVLQELDQKLILFSLVKTKPQPMQHDWKYLIKVCFINFFCIAYTVFMILNITSLACDVTAFDVHIVTNDSCKLCSVWSLLLTYMYLLHSIVTNYVWLGFDKKKLELN